MPTPNSKCATIAQQPFFGPTRVYLAGPIGKNDWRGTIVPDRRREACFERALDPNFVLPTITHGVISNGPFFISCDHGCAHGASDHGIGASHAGCFEDKYDLAPKARRSRVFKLCEERVTRADAVFSYFDRAEAYGSCAELGIAHAYGKIIFVAFSPTFPEQDEHWFAAHLSVGARQGFVGSVIEAWNEFLTHI